MRFSKPSIDVAFFAVSSVATLLLGGVCVASIVQNNQNAPFVRSAQHIVGAKVSDVVGNTPNFLGSESAPYTVVVFGDYECPPCQRMHDAMVSWLPQNKQVRYAFRNYPLDMHPYAHDAALAAEAAREQNKFWQMHDLLYKHQDELGEREIEACATQIGLDLTRFHRALQTSAKAQVEADQTAAEKLGVHAAPTLILCEPDGSIQTVNMVYLKSRF